MPAKTDVFLIGMLSGVTIAAAFTYLSAIPANNYYWQSQIWERGGGTFTMDFKAGRTGWKWLIEPKGDTPSPSRRGVASPRDVNVSRECL